MSPSALRATSDLKRRVALALAQDTGTGDVTSRSIFPRSSLSRAVIIAKQAGIVAGLPVAALVCRCADRKLCFLPRIRDGQRVKKGAVIAEIRGPTVSLLEAERILLNFLQRMSGIATLTGEFVRAVRGTQARILDTRKTTSLWRDLEKYAVRTGGGTNHRMGLYDAVLIKDNHIAASGGIPAAVRRVRKNLRKKTSFLEIETTCLREVREAYLAGADRILLDNMPLSRMRKCVRWIKRQKPPRPLLEASGSITLSRVRDVARTGADLISVGALTHSAPALDLSLLIEP